MRTSSAVSLLRYHLRHTIGRSQAMYLPVARLRHSFNPYTYPVHPATEIVIEGFPRSANSFAVSAFCQAQPRSVKVAHHVHLAVQVLYALRHNIPTLVLIREPEPAILSYMLLPAYPSPSPRHALGEYLRFYETVRPYRDQFVLADFKEVVTDFGRVIQRVNNRFGTDFQIFEHTKEHVDTCFKAAEEASREQNQGRVSFTDVARPHAARDKAKEVVRQRLYQPEFEEALARANDLYREMIG